MSARNHGLGRLITLAAAGLLGCGSTSAAQSDGESIYLSNCARCHGQDGQGGIPQPGGVVSRNFNDRAFQSSHSDVVLGQVIREGKPPAMPGFGHMLDDAQVDALVAHIRGFAP
jgi:cytochrome c oxidase cbb3-type subunit III